MARGDGDNVVLRNFKKSLSEIESFFEADAFYAPDNDSACHPRRDATAAVQDVVDRMEIR